MGATEAVQGSSGAGALAVRPQALSAVEFRLVHEGSSFLRTPEIRDQTVLRLRGWGEGGLRASGRHRTKEEGTEGRQASRYLDLRPSALFFLVSLRLQPRYPAPRAPAALSGTSPALRQHPAEARSPALPRRALAGAWRLLTSAPASGGLRGRGGLGGAGCAGLRTALWEVWFS